MGILQQLCLTYGRTDCRDLGSRQLEQLRDGLKLVKPEEVNSLDNGRKYIDLLRKFRDAVAENDKLHGDNYPQLLNALLSVGEDGLYSNNLRFIFELIQNVDDCNFSNAAEPELDIRFDFNNNMIVLTYNEKGFEPFNVFAITGIAEAAKNISANKNEIGEKGIGFKSVFGVADKVLIRSGWFSFELHKQNFTLPVTAYDDYTYINGTEMILHVFPGKAKEIYQQLKSQYCKKDALFSKNPLLFLNKLTKLKMHFDSWRSMEFNVSRSNHDSNSAFYREDDVFISIDLHDYDNGLEIKEKEEICCVRYTYAANYCRDACQSRYGDKTVLGSNGGKKMLIQAVIPYPEHISSVGNGALYSFLPTQLQLNVPIACHVPFKLDASREFVDPQKKNLWFSESCKYLLQLLEYSYSDWCKTAGANIVKYLAEENESLFRKNNGKELCLSEQQGFKGSHFLTLPLFFTADNNYRTAEEIICFDQRENIADPETVYLLLDYQKELFVPPEDVKVTKFGIDVEHNIYLKLFESALKNSKITSEALCYLDSVRFRYEEDVIEQLDSLSFTIAQLEDIIQHDDLLRVLQGLARKCLTKGKRPNFAVKENASSKISQVLYEGFEISEAPKAVENYLKFCGERCVLLDIDESRYLPCHNALVLSKKNALSSFGAFCNAIDQRDTFSIRIRLREASMRLNQYDETDSINAFDYLRELKNNRLVIKESLGQKGYNSYIDLILKSGTERGRFIHELLQNADDCDYPDDVIPSFSLSLQNKAIVTEYNECGFTPANVRSITAIGESTKNNLLRGNLDEIGQKGVGFKTIFAVASEVRISSGDFSFSLTDREPTIPREVKTSAGRTLGTRMEIFLKDKDLLPIYTVKSILDLCLCLRKLKRLEISGHTVNIEDTGSVRIITIDKKQYSYKKFVRVFTVDDAQARTERENGTRSISDEQSIICYVPEKSGESEYPLYAGLPTTHKIKMKLVIDAPFNLTTSREQIETGSAAWNGFIRKEMYAAIIDVMEALKTTERTDILRFSKFRVQRHGTTTVYVNDISDYDYLNKFDFLSVLQASKILPTFDKDMFITPQSKSSFRIPDVVHYLFARGKFGTVSPGAAIDLAGKEYDSTLKALACEEMSFENAFAVLEKYAETFIHDEIFRLKLYEYLQTSPPELRDRIRNRIRRLAIIPVYGKTEGVVEYVCWKEGDIFVKENAKNAPENYYILNENLLSKASCEAIFRGNINEMTAEWESNRYNDDLRDRIHSSEIDDLYHYLITEFKKGSLKRYDSLGVLLELKDFIPLKNQLGEITKTELFVCKMPSGYFPVDMICKNAVHEECAQLASYLKYRELSNIHYENMNYTLELTEDDVESLKDDYFVNSEEILRGFYRDGLLPDTLLATYDLEYLSLMHSFESEKTYSFPDDPVLNETALQAHVRRLWQNPTRIVKLTVERIVDRGQDNNGNIFDLTTRDARDGVLLIYTPEGAHGICVCQMCRRGKSHKYIEVNNIEVTPQYYFPQLRIALCLECSKYFESLRSNTNIREAFSKSILSTTVTTQGHIGVPIGNGNASITFTAKHLREIQEILRLKNADTTIEMVELAYQ